MISVLHFSTADNDGGSGRSAYRIHQGLRRLGHRSAMLVGTKVTEDPDVDTVHGGGWRRIADRIAEEASRPMGLQYQWYPSQRRILRHPWLRRADVIQLYNTHGGWFSHRLLPALSRRAPIVWRLSDMWAVTGHCAYSGGCERWRTGCGACPDLGSYPPLARDTTAWLWRVKQRAYASARLTIVAPSSWTERIARESPLFAGRDVHRIPNGLNLSVFRPIERGVACEVLGVDPRPKTILFIAQVAGNNPRKGTQHLEAALQRLSPEYRLLIAGRDGAWWRGRVPQAVATLGPLSDDRLLAAVYAASDVVVIPSSVENMPNTAIEAMACGRPVVGFDAGGMRDAVSHGETGLLVPTGDVDGLAASVEKVLGDEGLRARLGAAGRARAEAEFDAAVEVRRFVELYASLR